jgi:rhodanese-related sulfurtransferase
MNIVTKTIGALCVVGFAALVAQTADAKSKETPETLAGATLVNADQVKKMLDSGTAVIDTRVAQEFAEATIKGAKSVPYKEKSDKDVGFDPKADTFDLAKLPADKSAPVVFFCNAGECWKSYKASKVAIDAGYKKIHWFRGGFPEWKSKALPTQ